MGRGSYGRAMGLMKVGFSRSYIRTFGKREAPKFVCNRCRNRFKQGDRAKQTTYNAWRHYPSCPKVGDRNR